LPDIQVATQHSYQRLKGDNILPSDMRVLRFTRYCGDVFQV